jgi:hypothetical protein
MSDLGLLTSSRRSMIERRNSVLNLVALIILVATLGGAARRSPNRQAKCVGN